MKEIIDNLLNINKKLESAPDPTNMDNNEMMHHYMEVMGASLYLLRICVSLSPSAKVCEEGYEKNDAVIVGQMVRFAKLYEGFYQHVAKNQLEFAGIFMRLLAESEIKIRYLLKFKSTELTNSFILSSYKAEMEMLRHINKVLRERELIPIEKRMKASIENELIKEGIDINDLLANQKWNMDGKTIKAMLKDLDLEDMYPFMYGGPSRWVHGGWTEMIRCHLVKENDHYKPRLDYGTPEPRTTGPTTLASLYLALEYIVWSGGDTTGDVQFTINKVVEYVRSLEQAHESKLSS